VSRQLTEVAAIYVPDPHLIEQTLRRAVVWITMDRTDVTPDPDELLETALTEPESFDAARTTRLIAHFYFRTERHDPDVDEALLDFAHSYFADRISRTPSS
jgi:hypothetical protein